MALGALAVIGGCAKSGSAGPTPGVGDSASGQTISVGGSSSDASSVPGPAPGACGGFAGLPLGDAVPLLQDRLRMAMPAGAMLEPRGHSIMSAPEAETQESRIVLDNGEARLVVLAWELAAKADSGWASRIASKAPPGNDIGERQTDAGLTMATVQARELDTSTEAVEVLRAWVAHPDGTLQMMVFYVNPVAAASGSEACRDLPVRALASLRAGERALQRGGSWRLPTGPAGEVLAIDLPDDWTVFTQYGPDFFVHRLVSFVPLFSEQTGGLVYFGGHPNARPRPDAVEEPGTLYGAPVTWARWTDQGQVAIEVITAVGGPTEWAYHTDDGIAMTVPRHAWYTHVRLSAPDAAGLDGIRAALAAARRE